MTEILYLWVTVGRVERAFVLQPLEQFDTVKGVCVRMCVCARAHAGIPNPVSVHFLVPPVCVYYVPESSLPCPQEVSVAHILSVCVC